MVTKATVGGGGAGATQTHKDFLPPTWTSAVTQRLVLDVEKSRGGVHTAVACRSSRGGTFLAGGRARGTTSTATKGSSAGRRERAVRPLRGTVDVNDERSE